MTELAKQLKVLHIISGDRWAGAEVQACTLLLQLRKMVELNVVLMNPGELERRLLDAGIETVVFDESRFGGAKIFMKLLAHIRRLKPDIIHTHRKKENILGAIAGRLASKAVSVRTVHGAPEFESKGIRGLQNKLDKLVGAHLQKAIIAVSRDLAAKLSGKFGNSRVVTIANGVDEDGISAGLQVPAFKSAKPNAIHIGIVGRLVTVKRVDIFIEMAALLVERQPGKQWQFHVIGDGDLEAELEGLSQRMGMQEAITFHGHRSDIHDCIAALDMVIMCSDHEGLPMTALECVALGTPLLAHKTGGLVEVLAGYPGQLVTDHTASGYCEGVLGLLNAERKADKLATEYSALTNAQNVHALYRQVVA
jgi:glycosyltransferase involved in cell wall biosynthesis